MEGDEGDEGEWKAFFGEWTEPQLIPDGQYIIGLKVDRGADGINALAFLATSLN